MMNRSRFVIGSYANFHQPENLNGANRILLTSTDPPSRPGRASSVSCASGRGVRGDLLIGQPSVQAPAQRLKGLSLTNEKPRLSRELRFVESVQAA